MRKEAGVKISDRFYLIAPNAPPRDARSDADCLSVHIEDDPCRRWRTPLHSGVAPGIRIGAKGRLCSLRRCHALQHPQNDTRNSWYRNRFVVRFSAGHNRISRTVAFLEKVEERASHLEIDAAVLQCSVQAVEDGRMLEPEGLRYVEPHATPFEAQRKSH